MRASKLNKLIHLVFALWLLTILVMVYLGLDI